MFEGYVGQMYLMLIIVGVVIVGIIAGIGYFIGKRKKQRKRQKLKVLKTKGKLPVSHGGGIRMEGA